MYGKPHTKGNQTQARRWQWGHFSYASRRFKQSSLPFPISASDKASLRHYYAIQHLQQRGFAGFIPVYERKARVDFCRSVSQSKSRVNRKILNRANRTRIATKQGKLVWINLAITRQHQRVGDYCKQLASWFLCKVENNSFAKKLSSPCGGLIDPSISPYYGQITMAIYPCYGLIKGCFDTFLSPYCGHLLDIPLYTCN